MVRILYRNPRFFIEPHKDFWYVKGQWLEIVESAFHVCNAFYNEYILLSMYFVCLQFTINIQGSTNLIKCTSFFWVYCLKNLFKIYYWKIHDRYCERLSYNYVSWTFFWNESFKIDMFPIFRWIFWINFLILIMNLSLIHANRLVKRDVKGKIVLLTSLHIF